MIYAAFDCRRCGIGSESRSRGTARQRRRAVAGNWAAVAWMHYAWSISISVSSNGASGVSELLAQVVSDQRDTTVLGAHVCNSSP
jgi:hypothetical protein